MYWLSESFYTLFDSSTPLSSNAPGALKTARCRADVVIVGSGYGGAIAAQKLAEQFLASAKARGVDPASVFVLERGKEFVPGEFPEDIGELPSQVRINRPRTAMDVGYATSLFQIFPSDTVSESQVSVIVGSALGGGSQVNANVAKEPHASVFANLRWPYPLRDAGSKVLTTHFERVRQGLAARPIPEDRQPPKYHALRRVHNQLLQPGMLPPGYRSEFESPPIAVTFADGVNDAGVTQRACTSCGNCCSGCNVGAKNTLTMNYLPRAKRAGARLFTEALVEKLERDKDSGRFVLHVHPTAALDSPDKDRVLLLEATIVILAAGALGSTEILLRSNALRKHLSDRLGEQFSTNGDSISARHDTGHPVYAMGLGLRADLEPLQRRPGPTITGAIRLLPSHAPGFCPVLPSYTVEDCAIPQAITGFAAEALTTSSMLRAMQASSSAPASAKHSDPLGSDADAINNSEIYLTMAKDSACGRIVLDTETASGSFAQARIEWPSNLQAEYGPPQSSATLSLLDDILAKPSGLGGTYIPNPVREPLPRAMGAIMSNMPAGGVVTVHPLGGCSMGECVADGVVDHRGRVFDKTGSGVMEGLYVMDGAIIPCALETNPFLTIGALADRAVDELVRLDLPAFEPRFGRQSGPAAQALRERPLVLRDSSQQPARPTRFEFRERLRQRLSSLQGLEALFPGVNTGPQLQSDLAAGLVYLEMTLSYAPARLAAFLSDPAHEAALQGEVRLVRRRLTLPAFSDKDWEPLGAALPILKGKINLFRTVQAASPRTAVRAFGVYWARRLRREKRLSGKSGLTAKDLLPTFRFLAHVGARREVSYQFQTAVNGEQFIWNGRKEISYRKDSNVWKDLFNLPLKIESTKGTELWSGKLAVDLAYFMGRGAPQVLEQQSLPHSLVALTHYAMLYLRVIAQTYFYEFGPPDYPLRSFEPMRLPGPLAVSVNADTQLEVVPRSYWLPVTEWGSIVKQRNRVAGQGFEARLRALEPVTSHAAAAPTDSSCCHVAAYFTPLASKGAVLLLHGYAISSSMWASALIGKNLVQSLLEAGYDVYAADLRSSSALADVRCFGVSFDQIAQEDIPCLVEFAFQHQSRHRSLGEKRINLVAHCMGSAQFSMAILNQEHDPASEWSTMPPGQQAQQDQQHHQASFCKTASRIGRASFFQVAPLMAVTQANAARGRAAAVFDALVGNQIVSPWLTEADKVQAAEALLNRVAMTFPFDDDKDPGAPHPRKSSPYTGVTRKAFWLYGETWDNANLEPALMQEINDMIGAVNLKTYRQVGQFVREGKVVTGGGDKDLLSDRNLLAAYSQFDSLWLHGERSGMFEKQTTAGTAARLRELMHRAQEQRVAVEFMPLPQFGHLDSLIGRDAHAHGHRHVIEFFDNRFDGSLTPEYLAPYAPRDLLPRASDSAKPLDQAVLPVHSGPFQHRTPAGQLRVWFFTEGVLAAARPVCFMAVLEAGQDPSSSLARWAVWLTANESLAALHQYVYELPLAQLTAGSVLVFGSLPVSHEGLAPQGVTHGQVLDSAQLSKLQGGLQRLRDLGSFVDPGVLLPGNHASAPRSFLLGSCHYPGLMIDREYSERAFDAWKLASATDPVPEALVFAGDQVYVDALGNAVTSSSHADTLADTYVQAFGGVARSPGQSGGGLAGMLRRMSVHCVMDDHEFFDNFSRSGSFSMQDRDLAFKAFGLFQGPALPVYKYVGPSGWLSQNQPGDTLSGAGMLCGCDAFMLDTRYGRDRSENVLIDKNGWLALEAWAARVDKERPKFIVSGSVLLPVLEDSQAQPSSAIDDDSINGFISQRNQLLDLLVRYKLDKVVFLAGDYHLSGAGRAWLRGRSAESSNAAPDFLQVAFCMSSGLYAPLPFANVRAWELPACGPTHRLAGIAEGGLSLDFVLDTVYEGQSIARIGVSKNQGQWQVVAALLAADGTVVSETQLV